MHIIENSEENVCVIMWFSLRALATFDSVSIRGRPTSAATFLARA